MSALADNGKTTAEWTLVSQQRKKTLVKPDAGQFLIGVSGSQAPMLTAQSGNGGQ
jgi:hypothetical protein